MLTQPLPTSRFPFFASQNTEGDPPSRRSKDPFRRQRLRPSQLQGRDVGFESERDCGSGAEEVGEVGKAAEYGS